MDCTPEQIETKRRLALAKLQAKKFRESLENDNTKIGNNLKVSSSSVNFQQNKPSPTNFNTSVNIQNNTTYNNATVQNNLFKSKAGSSYPNHSSPSKILSNSNKCHNVTPYSKTAVSPQKFFGNTITGTIYLISDTRFEVNLSGFHAKAIEVFKSIPTRSYDNTSKMWNFDVKDYKLLHNKIQMLRPEVVVGEIPSFVLKALDEQKNYNFDVDLGRIDPELLNSLLSFQREGVIFGINHKGRLLIADEMGLGKTFQALAIAHYYKCDWPLLIVTTASMRNTWQETIQKYLPTVPLMSIQYMMTAKDYIQDSNVLIVSRDMLTRCAEKLLERNFGVIILDESHEFKNFKTKCSNSATQLVKKAKRVILLSGTPALSRPSELYTQLSFIDGKYFGNFIDYSKRYCDGKQTHFGWDASGNSNLAELEVVLSKKFMIRRTKNDVLQSLPNKTREVIKLDLTLSKISENELKCLDQLMTHYKAQEKGHNKHRALLSLFSETANIKIPSVCKYILNVLQERCKFLVFAHHQKMLDAVCSVLQKSKINYIRIDGGTSSDQRKFFIDKYQTKDDCICAVLSITAANAGITLTAAQLVIFAELHWNPSILAQAESRAHRIGQQNDVQVRYLLADGTADDYIWPMLLEKQTVLSSVGLTKDSFKDIKVLEQERATDAASSELLQNWIKKSEKKETLDGWVQNTSTSKPSDIKQSDELLQDDDDDLFLDLPM